MIRQTAWRRRRQELKICVNCNKAPIDPKNKSFCPKCWEHNKQYQRERLKRLKHDPFKSTKDTIGPSPTDQRSYSNDSSFKNKNTIIGRQESEAEITIKSDRRRNWQGTNWVGRADPDQAATGSFRYVS